MKADLKMIYFGLDSSNLKFNAFAVQVLRSKSRFHSEDYKDREMTQHKRWTHIKEGIWCFYCTGQGTVNSKSFVGKVLLRIKRKFELNYAL